MDLVKKVTNSTTKHIIAEKNYTLRLQNLQVAVIISDLFRFVNVPAIVNI